MTAPDPGLTDLIAAHRWTCSRDEDCICGWVGPFADFPTHVALVVEQHTNGRMAELEAEVEHWKARSQYNYDCGMVLVNEANARAEKAEAAIARAWAVIPRYSVQSGGKATEEQVGWLDGTKHVQQQLRAALEGEQQ